MPAEIRSHNGTPCLFLDGKPTFASYLWAHPPGGDAYAMAGVARRYADAGIHMYAFDVGVPGEAPEWCGPGNGRDDDFDFSTVEARFGRVLNADPDARFHLRVQLEMGRETGRWWRERNPEECELDSDGERTTQSFASEVWRREATAFLRAYVEHVDALGLGDRVIAYQTGAGHTGEWVKGITAMRSACGDYSAPMAKHFQKWLQERYEGNESALRRAWLDPDVTFKTAEVPAAEVQLTTTRGVFRDPAREQAVVDYFRCLGDLCADLVIDFNRTVKEASGGRALAGAFYGYLMELAWNAGFFGEGPDSAYSTYQRSGHLGLAKVLRSPHVDFLVSPYSYGFRGIGGHGPSMLPAESVRLHGKLYIYEDDTRTYLAPPDTGFGRTATLADSVAVLKRNVAEVLTRGHGIWWLGHGNHVDPVAEPAFGELLEQFQTLGTWAVGLDRSPHAEIAVFVDDESFVHTSLRNALDRPLIFEQRLWGLPRLGAPFDTYLLRDLIEGRVRPHKLYIFLNAFWLEGERRAAVVEQVRREGRTALWIYAPGYLAGAPDLANMTELTGFRFGKGDRAWGAAMQLVDFDHDITRGVDRELAWSIDGPAAPLFHIEDPDARVLGDVVYSQGRCLPGFGVKELDGWRSVYSAVPNLPAPVLRGIASYAGVHVYSDAGDVLYTSGNLLAVHTVAGGHRAFRLPEPVEVVYGLFEGVAIAQDTDRFDVRLPARSTSLFYVGSSGGLAALEDSRE